MLALGLEPRALTTRIPLGRAHMLASTLIREARRAGLPADLLVPVGSLRRFSPDIGDVSLLGVAPAARHRRLLDGFGKLSGVSSVISREADSTTVQTDRGPARLLLTVPDHAGSALVWHTGSRGHVALLQQKAHQLGLSFAGVLESSGTAIRAATEDELYNRLGLPFIPPELREGADEVAAAEAGTLPRLISDGHIRGDLHMHSTWSDGRDTIEAMVLASRQLGYEYVAITDHSEHAWSSRKVTAEEVPDQRAEVELLRQRYPAIQILHGIEVDIMHDGSLDFDDELLGGFDIVLASLHDHGGHDGPWLTERYLRAIRHPMVNVITHPANRSPAQSSGYDVDFDRLFAAAAGTGTAMEIDGAPGHLDLDGRLARRAIAAGVTLVVDSDCHRAEALARQMRWGIGTARRGWTEPQHVLNTRSVDEVRAFVASKRERG
jgi:DNA polymerase (family X)